MLTKQFIQIGQRGFHTQTIALARHSAKRTVPCVVDPPRHPAPKSEFFNNLPSPKSFHHADLVSEAQRRLESMNEPEKVVDYKMPTENIIYQNGIGEKEKKFLFETTPKVLTQSQLSSFNVLDPAKIDNQTESMRRLVSLNTANAKGIRAYNVERCVEHFGRKEGDTGSPEVQAAVWTLKIRNLEYHLGQNRKDLHNRRKYEQLLHKRAKILKYLKKKSLERYYVCLKELGITPEMVEGQISIRQTHN